MNRSSVLPFIFAALLIMYSRSAISQISIDSAAYSAAASKQYDGIVVYSKHASLFSSILSQDGADRTWNFDIDTFVQNGVDPIGQYLKYPVSGVPFENDSNLPSSTNIIKEVLPGYADTMYEFIQLTGGGVWYVADVDISSGVATLGTVDDPPRQELQFPLTYSSAWYSTYTAYNSSSGGWEVHSVYDTVDGWGMLLTSPNVSTPALRVRQSDSVVFSNDFSSGTSYTIRFVTLTGIQTQINYDSTVIYSVSSNASNLDGVAQQTTSPTEGIGLAFSSNPSTAGGTTLFYMLPEAANVQISIMDLLGRTVTTFPAINAVAGKNSVVIPPGILSAGSYFVSVRCGSQMAVKKLIATE